MRALVTILLLAFLVSSPATAGNATAELVEIPLPEDSISPAQLARIEAALETHRKRQAAARTAADEGPFLYPFFPQAGLPGRDLFLTNFTDQDPSPGLIRDWDCSDYTYDGHQGHDSVIRSFREQAIGVPVFAVRDGVVVDAHDGEPDMNTEWRNNAPANYVILDHGGGYTAWYFHFKRGSVAVAPGQQVTAGTQLGLTGSSGISNWPHLHFETRRNGAWFEPSAGPCRSGDSLWASQPPVVRGFYVSDFLLTPGRLSIPDIDTFLLDEAPRTGTFVKGLQTFSVRLDLRNLPTRSTFRVSVLNPRGKVAAEVADAFGNAGPLYLALGLFSFDVDLNTPGKWRLRAEINGAVAADAQFTVVQTSKQVKNRPPKKVTARLSPKSPVEGKVMTCEVQTSLVTEDPDFDVVSYRYEWRVNGRVARSVTSAALTDLLPAGAAKAKDRVTCKVTPSDGRRSGPPSLAGRSAEEP